MPTLKRYSGTCEINGRTLTMDFTLERYAATQDEPASTEMYDTVYYVDGIKVDEADLSDEMQERTYALAASAEQIPWNFGPPDDFYDRE